VLGNWIVSFWIGLLSGVKYIVIPKSKKIDCFNVIGGVFFFPKNPAVSFLIQMESI
jgi:hypothetical protein